MTITIFLADSAAMFREGLWLLLETQPDFKVVGSADDGSTAVREIERLSPTIAIVDIDLPGMDGIEVTRELAKLGVPTRIIILTMHTLTNTVVEALRAGVFGYVFKSSLSSEIVEAIQLCAEGRKYLHPTLSQFIIEEYIVLDGKDQAISALAQLSAREREVLQLLIEGHSSAEIAKRLSLSVGTIDTYRSRIMRKLQVKDFVDLVRFTIQNGLIRLA